VAAGLRAGLRSERRAELHRSRGGEVAILAGHGWSARHWPGPQRLTVAGEAAAALGDILARVQALGEPAEREVSGWTRRLSAVAERVRSARARDERTWAAFEVAALAIGLFLAGRIPPPSCANRGPDAA
jgi:hypothetical protein